MDKVTNDYRLTHWAALIKECSESGLSKADWCSQHNIPLKTYYYWQKRVWDKEIMDLSPETKTKLLESRSIQFAQVNLGPVDSSSDADIVIRKDAWTVEIRNSASPVLLSTVLEAVVRGV
jgi:hypothetical protein